MTRDEVLRIIDEEIGKRYRDETVSIVLRGIRARIAPQPDKPCPFCGAEEIVTHFGAPDSWVLCRQCGAQGPRSCDAKSRALWNRRAEG